MNNWLEQARAANAALGEVRQSAPIKARIDRSLRLRRRIRGAVMSGAGVAVALAIAVVMSRASTSTTTSTSTSTHAKAPAPASTSTSTDAELRFADGSRVVLTTQDARVAIERDDERGARAVLSAGGARFEVQARRGKPFVVQAGELQVRVVGTRFSVTRSAALVEVAVEHGEVEVLARGEVKRLRAGEAASFGADAARIEPESEPELEPVQRARAERAGRDAAGELLAAADLARREGRAQDAIAALQALVQRHGRDPRAPSAAFSLGRVLLETQQRPREAAAAFARVAQLDAKSPLVEDALAREIEAWAKAGEAARARARAAAYLARFPSGARAAFVRKHAQLE